MNGNGIKKLYEEDNDQNNASNDYGGGDANANGGTAGAGAEDSKQSLEPEQFRKLFIGGLSLNTTDSTLHEFYSQFGQLVDCIVMRDSNTKRSRGFGFVSFSSQAEVDSAMNARPHTIDGKVVDPKRAVPRDQSQKTEQNMSIKRLYVSGVREEHTEEMFERYFGEFGQIQKVELIKDKNTQKNRGFAFITFDDYDPVDRCVLLKSHMINGYRCDVKKALSRDDMQKAQQKERDLMERGMRSRGGGRGGGGYGRGGGGGYGPPGGGYGGYGGGGYGPPPPAWGPPAGPPAWGGGYNSGGMYGGGGTYGQAAPAPWSAQGGGGAAPAGGPPAAADQWSAAGGAGGYAGGWGGAGATGAGAASTTGDTDYSAAAWGGAPQGVPPPPSQWGNPY